MIQLSHEKNLHLSSAKQLEFTNKEPGQAETATGDVLYRKLFLKISQNAQELTCARVSFLIKSQA